MMETQTENITQEQIQTKVCNNCRLTLPIDKFREFSATKDGRYTICKKCEQIRRKEYQQAPDNIEDAERLIEIADGFKSKNSVRSPTRNQMRLATGIAAGKYSGSHNGKYNHKKRASRFYKNCFQSAYGNLVSLGLEESVIRRFFGANRNAFDDNTRYDEDADNKYAEAREMLQTFLSREILVRGLGLPYVEEIITYKRVTDSETGRERWQLNTRRVEKKQMPPNGWLLLSFMYNNYPEKWKNAQSILTGKIPTYDDRKKIAALARDVLEANTDRTSGESGIQGGLARVSGEFNETGKE